MNRTLIHAAVILATAGLAGSALAGGDKHEYDASKNADRPSFSKLDTDSDGTVTKEELRKATEDKQTNRLKGQWSKLDTDQDGKLDRAEFARFEPTGKSERMDKSDAHRMDKSAPHGMDKSDSAEKYRETDRYDSKE